MTRSYRAVLVALSMIAAAPALAGDTKATSTTKNSQNDKMTECNKKAEGMKGDERKAFMSKCLSADSKSKNTQNDKMTACNKKAEGMKGDERKAFMSKCLSGEKK